MNIPLHMMLKYLKGAPNTVGEYLWEQSLSLRNMKKSIELLKTSLLASQGSGANETLVTSTKEHLAKAEKVLYVALLSLTSQYFIFKFKQVL